MIRMLKAWNGYPQQAIVSLSGSEETRLVGLGLASFDLDGEADAEFLVKAKTNPLTGGIEILGIPQRVKPGVRKVMLLGDSMTVSNNIVKTISAVNRSGGVCTASVTGHVVPRNNKVTTFNIVPENMNVRNADFTYIDANTISWAAPGADGAGANLSGTKTMGLLNLAARNDQGLIYWLNSLSGGAYEVVHNGGRNGNTAADCLGRIDLELAAGADAHEVIFLTGYNDFVIETKTAEAVMADVAAIAKACFAAGKEFSCISAMPVNTAASATIRGNMVRYNRLAHKYFERIPGARFVDVTPALLDAASGTAFSAKAGYINSDNIHISSRGWAAAAAKYWSQFPVPVQDRFAKSVADTYGYDASSKNILDVGPWSSANVAGVATGLTISTSNCTVTPTVVARADGSGYDQHLVMQATGANGWTRLTLTTAIPAARYADATELEMALRIALVGVAGSNFRGNNVSFSFPSDSVNSINSAAASATYYPQDDREINFVSQRTKIPAGATTVNFFVYFIFDSAGTVLTADVGNISIEKI